MPEWIQSSCTNWIREECKILVKLVVHIGHGKTGSSSIQRSLLQAGRQLDSQGVKYLGLMLEHAGNVDKKTWQQHVGSDIFFDRMKADQACAELEEVISQELARLSAEGFRKAIWSNEWILQRPNAVIPALKALVEQGYDLEIQAYIRRHDKWAISAYTQWGIRHKNYKGPIVPFELWAEKYGGDLSFSNTLKPWEDAFSSRLRLMNFDASGDAVEHFMRRNGLVNIPTVKENVSPAAAVVACQAVYNSRKRDAVQPQAFDSVLRFSEQGDENRAELPDLNRLMPSVSLLENLLAENAQDISHINELLVSSGEPTLNFEDPAKGPEHPEPWAVDQVILKLVFALIDETERLKSQVNALQAKIAAQASDKAS